LKYHLSIKNNLKKSGRVDLNGIIRFSPDLHMATIEMDSKVPALPRVLTSIFPRYFYSVSEITL